VDLRALGQQAMTLQGQGRLAEAESLYRKILATDPHVFPALYLLGSLRLQLGDSGEAADLLAAAVKLAPNELMAQAQYGMALIGLGRFDEAVAPFNRALAAKPQMVLALSGRAAAFRGLGRTQESLADYEAVVRIDPGNPDVWCGRGALLRKLGRIEEALESFNRALALWPDFPEALQNRGALLWDDRRDFPAALADLERAMARDPGRPDLPENLLHLKMMMAHDACDLDWLEDLAGRIPALVSQGAIVPAWMLLLSSDNEKLQLQNARNLVAKRFASLPPLWTGERYDHQRIRLAYISSDFKNHAVAGQIAELIEHHDRSRFEVIAISTSADDASDLRRRLMTGFDAFHDLYGQDASAIARQIRELEVDILVDLNGHTEHDNFDVLRRRVCPAQVSWLGYAGTTGAPLIDAIIADAVVAPEAHAFSEKLYLLPDTVFCADTTRAPGPVPMRAEAGLPENAFVFCAFNRHWKITASVFASWMRILKAVPGSVLWLKHPPAQAQSNLAARAAALDVDPARLIYAPPVPLEDHLARHTVADLFLDTFPYTGHATTCDALWAGLPVLTRKGNSYAARVAASQLQAIRLPELVTETAEDYEALAIALAQDSARLKNLRERLAHNRAATPLFDTKRFARNLEENYTRILADRFSG
jgi:predicted O-linked N-acetylglucosamine transferase (SPINDLY family)